MQHYSLPTRLIDLSEDAFTALFFALYGREKVLTDCKKQLKHTSINASNDFISTHLKECYKNINAVVYLVEIDKNKIKYYDSDTVTVLSNLTKLPLGNKGNWAKSKKSLQKITKMFINNTRDDRDCYNKTTPFEYLIHEIKDDIGHFENKIDPKHIFSVQCVKTKLSNPRIQAQKGTFLIFGLNAEKAIPIIEKENGKLYLAKDNIHMRPIKSILKIRISPNLTFDSLKRLGITYPYIYTGLEKISEYLKNDEF